MMSQPNCGTEIVAEVPLVTAEDATQVKSQVAGDKTLKRIRVLLADDHQMLADALKGVLEPRFEVVGTVRDGRALVEAAAKLQPEVVVVDVAMPD